ncbi:Semaphorin-3F [Clarias magur]|uniref:Semaphorin-3F n=1 Tax=Clarias magur TaxID=1594786 RepID=A0A8J4U2J8_CLAMG|nr:Semaphorin-3F [Clarias magur]
MTAPTEELAGLEWQRTDCHNAEWLNDPPLVRSKHKLEDMSKQWTSLQVPAPSCPTFEAETREMMLTIMMKMT